MTIKQSGTLTALCVAIATVALLIPAIINGYPFVFWDTGTNLFAALRRQIPYDRPVFYSLFSLALHWQQSPWPIVAAQAALTAVLIRMAGKSLLGVENPWATPMVAAILAIASSLPWFAGQILPDIFTPILILALMLITLGWERLTALERLFAIALVPFCVSMHNGNLLVVLSALPAVAAVFLLGWRPGPQAFRRLALVAGGAAIAITAIAGSNYAARGKLVLSSASSTLLFAKLLDDGPAMAVLEQECPTGYALCSQLPKLQAHRAAGTDVSLADYFLWGGPLDSLGWWTPVEPEAAQIVRKALAQSWPRQALTSIANGGRQFLTFETGEGLIPDPGQPARDAIRIIFGADSLAAFRTSLQGAGKLDFNALNWLHLLAIVLSFAFLLWRAVTSWRVDRRELYLLAFLLTMLLAHAMAIGALTPLHGRYQSRVMWLIPLFALLAAVARRRSPESVSAPSLPAPFPA
jgi:hypothetical protein